VHVIALDVASGAKRWESSLDGALDGDFSAAYPPVCREDLGKVFVSYWGGPQGVAALDLASGQTLWNIAASGTPQIKAATAGAVVFSDLSPSFTTTVRALAPATGVELWSYAASGAGDTPFADADDALFRLTGSQLVRIDPLAGTQIWTHSATATIPSGERGVIYVARDGVLVEKVDTASGTAAWTYPSTPGQTTPAIRLLGNTVVLSRAGNAETGFTALDASTGAELWQRIVPASYAYMTSDPLGRLFVVGAESLENVARADGNPLWVFAAPLVDGYGPSHIQSVVDGDARGVYVLFMDYGTGNAPAGLGALDPATGAARWLAFQPGSMYFVGSDATWLFMQLTGMAGPIEGRAYAK
jgi:outer membrane protein assembly factor BamB